MSAAPALSRHPTAPLADESLAALCAQAWKHDLPSLFAALRRHGYGWDELRFASHVTTESPAQLVHSLALLDEPRRALLTLNLGLLSAQSPLPAYFFKELDAGTLDATTFFRFLGFFDQVALSRLLLALHPELDRQLFADFERTRQEELELLNLRATATLHWLFQQLFPELGVRVEAIRKTRLLRTGTMRLGSGVLGDEATFGGRASSAGPGRRMTLFSDDDRAGSGRPWPIEARARLDERILPLLRAHGVQLEVFVVIREQQSWSRLAAGSFLGYDQLRGGRGRRRIQIVDTSEEDRS